jgi:hypothetical protein
MGPLILLSVFSEPLREFSASKITPVLFRHGLRGALSTVKTTEAKRYVRNSVLCIFYLIGIILSKYSNREKESICLVLECRNSL